jgi:hypothetical protein
MADQVDRFAGEPVLILFNSSSNSLRLRLVMTIARDVKWIPWFPGAPVPDLNAIRHIVGRQSAGDAFTDGAAAFNARKYQDQTLA